MSKKSIQEYRYRKDKPKCLKFLHNKSKNTQKSYYQAIRKYEEFHDTTIEELIKEALEEQSQQVPPHLLKIIDRIEEFQNHLIEENYVHGTIKNHITRIKTTYTRNRVTIPYIEELNPLQTKRREVIEYKDIITKEEIKQALNHMRLPAQARTLTMVQGGLSNKECDELTLEAFINETYKYHQETNLEKALRWLSDPNNPIIWVTRITRVKTGKPYYCIIGSEAVNKIAESKLYEMVLPKNKDGLSNKLLDMNIQSFGKVCRDVNRKCGFGFVAEESRLRPHMLRKYHGTHIKGSFMTYEEHSIISNADIDELHGRGKTHVQDTYIKTNPLQQKLLYAKVMNNLSLFHEYDYSITSDDVIVSLRNPIEENKKLRNEVRNLSKSLQKKKNASDKVEKLREELGDDGFKELINEILSVS